MTGATGKAASGTPLPASASVPAPAAAGPAPGPGRDPIPDGPPTPATVLGPVFPRAIPDGPPTEATAVAETLASRGPEQATRAPGKTSTPAADAPLPANFGRYRVLRRLGEGGMGQVFEARDPSLDRVVAIKVLTGTSNQDPVSLERFLREARAAAALDDPHVVQVYDVGTEGAVHYLALELVPGRSLASLLARRGKLPPAEAVGYAIQAAQGLAAAHAIGIVHRDVKPGNLLLGDSGVVKVADFGLARRTAAQDAEVTQAGDVLGTPLYLSPEQAMALPVDFRTDIYSLGATLYHLLAGRPPFAGASVLGIIADHIHRPLTPLHAVDPELPRELGAVVGRMMAKNPAERYDSYAALIAALEAATRARPPFWRGRRPQVAGIAVAAVVLAAGLFALARPPAEKAGGAAPGSGPAAPSVGGAATPAPGASPEEAPGPGTGGGAPAIGADTASTVVGAGSAGAGTAPAVGPGLSGPVAPLQTPVERLARRLRGGVTELADGRLELAYDFSAPEQLLDWTWQLPPMPGTRETPWRVAEGRLEHVLVAQQLPPMALPVTFAGDLEVEGTYTPLSARDVAGMVHFHQSWAGEGLVAWVSFDSRGIGIVRPPTPGSPPPPMVVLEQVNESIPAPATQLRFRVRTQGTRIELYRDGQLEVATECGDYLGGKVALHLQYGWAAFDDLRVRGRLAPEGAEPK